MTELQDAPNPVLTASDVTDIRAGFVADPFAVAWEGVWHLFFEVLNRDSGKGEIAYAWSPNLRHWTYGGRVLEEPFHLSYPAVYSIDGHIWMLPETWEAGEVRLYRAIEFPQRWAFEGVLLNVAGTDPTIYRSPDGSLSMLLCAAVGEIHNETLHRFEAPRLQGPWSEAAESPLVVGDASQARPGGSCFEYEGTTYRLGQDCSRRYGERVRSFPLKPPWTAGGRTVVAARGDGWRARAGHHADLHRQLDGTFVAFADGESHLPPRNQSLAHRLTFTP